jgi:nucleoside-triphosphatase
MIFRKNLFITGAPSSGKTTVIKKVIAALTMPANGFYTEEERINGRRIGFLMHTLDGQSAYLAHQDIDSEYHIRRYGISIPNIERVAVPAIAPIDRQLIIIDEIGKMECFSTKFIQAATQALDSPNHVVGTITLGGTGFIKEVKERSDIDILEVTPENRNQLPGIILNHLLEDNKDLL